LLERTRDALHATVRDGLRICPPLFRPDVFRRRQRLNCRKSPPFYPKLKMENEVSIKVTIWNEGRHEKLQPDVAVIYPSGIHGAIAAGLENDGFAVCWASLDDPDEGLGEQLLDDSDVRLWWGHIPHE